MSAFGGKAATDVKEFTSAFDAKRTGDCSIAVRSMLPVGTMQRLTKK